ncbi:MAG TPA: hypothetical protein VJ935_03885 [Acidimicrobiia bacterium]|nr:hypothetical protein [Acidimicrobiia bacterium]
MVLPPGERTSGALQKWLPASIIRDKEVEYERLDICEKLNPLEVVIGAPRSDDPDDLYVVYVYRKAIIAESPLVGNAAFVLFPMPREEWMLELSLPKSEVDAERIIHGSRGIWKLQLKTVVDHGPPLWSVLYMNGVPHDFEAKRDEYLALGEFVLPDDHIP